MITALKVLMLGNDFKIRSAAHIVNSTTTYRIAVSNFSCNFVGGQYCTLFYYS